MALLQTIENEFDAAGDAELFENTEQIISYDLLRERGWSARRVALTCYGLTGALCATGLAIIQWGLVPQLMICLAISGGLVATGVRLGSLRGDETIRGEIEVSESSERETLWSKPAASAQRVRPKA